MRRWLYILPMLLALTVAGAEWDLGPKRVEVTINSAYIDESTDFVIIPLSAMPAGFWTGRTDYDDVRATTSDADTQVAVHIWDFDSGSDVGWLRAATSTDSASDATFVVYYGDGASSLPAAGSTYGSQNAYGSDVAAAYTFDGGSLTDETGNGHDLTNNNSATTATGPVTGMTAYDFNGTTQYLSATAPVTTWPVTIVSYAAPDSATSDGYTSALGSSSDDDPFLVLQASGTRTGDPFRVVARDDAATNVRQTVTSTGYSASTWYQGATSRATGTATLSVYIDGGSTGTDAGTLSTTTWNTFAIGTLLRASASGHYNGKVGLTYVYDEVKSANYLTTLDNMINDAGNTFTFGSEEEESTSGVTDWETPGTVSQTTGPDGANAWANTANLQTDNTSYSESSPANEGDHTNYLHLTNFGFAVPDGSAPTGVEFRYRRLRSGATKSASLKLRVAGTDVGTSQHVASPGWASSAETVTRGASDNLWGYASLSRAQVNASTFGFTLLAYSDTSGGSDVRIEFVEARVHYDAASDATDLARGAFAVVPF